MCFSNPISPRAEAEKLPICKTKLGFVCTVLTDAAGNLVYLEIIWEGTTAAAHAKPGAPNPLEVM